jgi:hypothetical protein
LAGDDPTGAYTQLIAVANSIGFTVEDAELPGECNGLCSYLERCIRVEVRNDRAQQAKTLAHEIAHACCTSTAMTATSPSPRPNPPPT